jgi:hypothetical protein
MFANKSLTFTLIESLPKEKTAILGTAELNLYKKFLRYFTKENHDSPVPECNLFIRETIPIVYLNSKLLASSTEKIPEVTVEISISRPLISTEALQHGVFVSISIDDMQPLPEEWSTKEANDKDLNSNLYSYSINIIVPSDKDSFRIITIPNGSLMLSQEVISFGKHNDNGRSFRKYPSRTCKGNRIHPEESNNGCGSKRSPRSEKRFSRIIYIS